MASDHAEIIEGAYQLILGRGPDPDGLSKYRSALENGGDFNDVCLVILDSQEAKRRNLTIAQSAGCVYRATNGDIVRHPRWIEIVKGLADHELRETRGRGIVIGSVDGSSLLTVSHVAETMISGFLYVFSPIGKSAHVRVLKDGITVAEASCDVAHVSRSAAGPLYVQLRFTGLTTSHVDWSEGAFEVILADEQNNWSFVRAPLKPAQTQTAAPDDCSLLQAPPQSMDASSVRPEESSNHIDHIVTALQGVDPETLQMVTEIVDIVLRRRR